MMVELFVSADASQSTRISLNNTILYINLDFSTREKAWYFSLFDVNRNPFIQGLKLQFGVSPTQKLENSPLDGNLYIFKNSDTSDPIGRSNLGQGKDYSLVYVTTTEELSLSA